jgi:transposase
MEYTRRRVRSKGILAHELRAWAEGRKTWEGRRYRLKVHKKDADRKLSKHLHNNNVELNCQGPSFFHRLLSGSADNFGIGKFSSLMILGEISDIKRFSNPKSLVSYAGLCPEIYQPGSRGHDVANRACNK